LIYMSKKPKPAPAIRQYSVGSFLNESDQRVMEQLALAWGKSKFTRDLNFFSGKILEEFGEYLIGDDEVPQFNSNNITTTGDTKFSESITVILTILHWQREHTGFTYGQLLSLLVKRYAEQADRHHIKMDELVKSTYEIGVPLSNTYWFIRTNRIGTFFGVKIELANGQVAIREVFHGDPRIHLIDDNFILPSSYEPFMDEQWWAHLDSETRGVQIDHQTYLDFFNPMGVELVHTKKHIYNYVKLEDLAFKKPILGDFEGMRFA